MTKTVQIRTLPTSGVTKYVNRELWAWMRSQAILNHRTIGEQLNVILAEAKERAEAQ